MHLKEEQIVLCDTSMVPPNSVASAFFCEGSDLGIFIAAEVGLTAVHRW